MYDNYILYGAIGIAIFLIWRAQQSGPQAAPSPGPRLIPEADRAASLKFETNIKNDLAEAEVERRETALDEARRLRRGKKLEEALRGPSA